MKAINTEHLKRSVTFTANAMEEEKRILSLGRSRIVAIFLQSLCSTYGWILWRPKEWGHMKITGHLEWNRCTVVTKMSKFTKKEKKKEKKAPLRQ